MSSGTVLKGSLLVAGTATGGGMLALPVLTSLGGFIPSIFIYLLCWLFMTCTGLLFVEIALCMNKGANIISMSERTLGRVAKVLSWLIYMGLFYCLLVAYIVGCGNLISEASHQSIPDWFAPFLFALIVLPFAFAGTRIVGRLNVVLMLGLIVSFVVFLILGIPFVKMELLAFQNWSKTLWALPIAFTAFAYHGIVPTLVEYLEHDVHRIRKSIIIGTTSTLIIYVIWQWLIQGIVPTYAPGGLAEALSLGDNAVQPLKNFINEPIVYVVGQYFAFFALITSFFGVVLGLIDFLADGLSIKKTISGRTLLCGLVLIPPLLIAYSHPHVFLTALEYAGGYGCALLLGLLPILMSWAARYHSDLNPPKLLPGGKPLLVVLALFVIFEVFFESSLTLEKLIG